MLLLIDNYDSFVYNLARYFVELGCETRVIRNDAYDVATIRSWNPQAIVISPGPCSPAEAGISVELIAQLSQSVPILGVCLGHQAIAAAFAGRVIRAPEPIHGRSSLIEHQGTGLFQGLPTPLRVARYHSLIIDRESLHPELEITATTADGIPMAVQHRSWPLYGVQFHPESVMTEHGRPLLANFARIAGLEVTDTHVTDWVEPVAQGQLELTPVLAW